MNDESTPKGAHESATTDLMVTDRRAAGRFNRHDVRAHRSIVRELDEWFGIFHYPDVSVIYAMPLTREGEHE
jgi:hypothetical protein